MKQSFQQPVELPTTLPGLLYSADDQCVHQYGHLARQCTKPTFRVSLYCVFLPKKFQASWAENNVMYTLWWGNHKTDMESLVLGDACETLVKRQGFDLHEAFGIYIHSSTKLISEWLLFWRLVRRPLGNKCFFSPFSSFSFWLLL